MKIMVTGGAGYIGSALCPALEKAGHQVRVYDNFSLGNRGNLEGCQAEIVEGDVRDYDSLLSAMNGCQAAIHLAAIPSVPLCDEDPRRAVQTNVNGTFNFLEACRERGVGRAVYANGAAATYGRVLETPITESHPPNPVNYYGVTKFSAELLCHAAANKGLPVTVFRQANVYGPAKGMKTDSVIPIFVAKCLKGEEIKVFGSGKQVRNFVFIDDLVNAYLRLLNSEVRQGVFNVGGPEEKSITGLAELVKKATGSDSKITRVDAGRVEVENKGFILSSEKAKKEFGFTQEFDLNKGILALAKHYAREE